MPLSTSVPESVIITLGSMPYQVTPRLRDFDRKGQLTCMLEEEDGFGWRSLGVLTVPENMVEKTIRTRIRAYLK